MKSPLNRELVGSLNESKNQDFVDQLNEKIQNIVANAVSDVSEKSPFVKLEQCIFLPVAENYTGAVAQMTKYSYFLGIDNPLLESNSVKKSNIFKNLWREFRANWRIGRKKYKKQKNNTISALPIEKYQLSNFRHDCFVAISNYLETSTILTEYNDHISLVGSEDFGTGVQVDIYICCFDASTNLFKYPIKNRNKFCSVNFGDRFSNLEAKSSECGEIFYDVIRMINNMFTQRYNRVPNQILVESLVFNCPNNLFDSGDIFKTFVNCVNFVRICDTKNLISICNADTKMLREPLITKTNAQMDFNKIILMFDKFKY